MVPLLSQIPLDMSFFKKETTSTSLWLQDTSEKMETESGDGSKENQDQLLPDSSSEGRIHLHDRPSQQHGAGKAVQQIRCFSDIICDQRIPNTIRQSVYLQTVTLNTVYSVAGKDETVYNRAVNEPSLSFIFIGPTLLLV